MTDWDRVNAVVAYLEAHPEEHNQLVWGRRSRSACGTTACMAGRTMLMFAPEHVAWVWEPATGFEQMQITSDAQVVLGFGGILSSAAYQLGLSDDDAEMLFLDCGDLAAIKGHLALMRARDGLPPLEIGAPA